MKTGKKLITLCLCSFALITCKKETLQPNNSVGLPTFYFNGNVNGTAVNLTAGVNNYYMYSSYALDSQNIYQFIGSLHPTNCNNCPNSIQFIINADTVTNGSLASKINSSLKVATYPFIAPVGLSATSFSVTYTPTKVGPNTSVTNYSYTFGDHSTASTTAASVTHIYNNPGVYTTTLITHFSAAPNDTITNITVAANSGILNASPYMFSSDSLGVILYDSLLSGTPNYTVNWKFGDGASHNTIYTGGAGPDTMGHKYANPFGLYTASVTATDRNNNTNTSVFKVNPQPTNLNYIEILKSSVSPVPNTALSNIAVVYTDVTGNVYSSANLLQPPTSAFQITTVSSYENNINGQTTKMLHIKFNCQLQDAANQTITITNGDAVIAVAYK